MHNHIAEAIIRLPGTELFAQASADDMYTSIKMMTEKLKSQLEKHRKMQLDYAAFSHHSIKCDLKRGFG